METREGADRRCAGPTPACRSAGRHDTELSPHQRFFCMLYGATEKRRSELYIWTSMREGNLRCSTWAHTQHEYNNHTRWWPQRSSGVSRDLSFCRRRRQHPLTRSCSTSRTRTSKGYTVSMLPLDGAASSAASCADWRVVVKRWLGVEVSSQWRAPNRKHIKQRIRKQKNQTI